MNRRSRYFKLAAFIPVPAALPEEVESVQREVVRDPHDLAREVVVVHDEVRLEKMN